MIPETEVRFRVDLKWNDANHLECLAIEIVYANPEDKLANIVYKVNFYVIFFYVCASDNCTYANT